MWNNTIDHWNAGAFFLQSPALAAIDALTQDDLLGRCLPERSAIFKAFEIHPASVRVVLLGQDPYPNAADAMGLAFSSPAPRLPASLRNIFKELAADLGTLRTAGNLSPWVAQGVLLANTALTVGLDGKSHFPYWTQFTRAWIAALAASHPVVWILWGKHAQSWKAAILDAGNARGIAHAIIESAHPSPLSAYRGFFGSRPFSQANAALQKMGYAEIVW